MAELCGYLGIASEHPPETFDELADVNIERFCAIARLLPHDMHSMLITRRAEFPIECVSWSDFQHCPTCTHATPGVSLRHWRQAWSLVCNSCASGLLPLRDDPRDKYQVPSRLQARACEGARQLEQVYLRGNHHAARRVDLTILVVGTLAPEFRQGMLFTQNSRDRYSMLSALNHGLMRPLLATALAMRNDPAAESRLRAAFPHQRKILDRLRRLKDSLPIGKNVYGRSRVARNSGQGVTNPVAGRPEYLAAARQAIEQLGATADRGELLQHAERIWETARKKPMDIS